MPRINRRSFLRSTAAAAAAPLLLPSRIWAAPADAKPNNRIVFGSIGVGTQGRHLLNSFLQRTHVISPISRATLHRG